MNSLEKFFYSISGKGLCAKHVGIFPLYVNVDAKQRIIALRKELGIRRYRIALLYHGHGMTPQRIAWRLGITTRSVERHLATIASKIAATKPIPTKPRTQRLDESRDYLQVTSLN